MILRKPLLSGSWYPGTAEEIGLFLKGMEERSRTALAAVAPHAGWVFSGAIAAGAIGSLDPRADTVVVIGGHLSRGMLPLYAEEDGVSTPLGDIMMDAELRDALRREIPGGPDHYRDNTVEVQLPLVRYFFPQARLLWLRLPAEPASFEAGACLARLGKSLKRKLAVLGSTDLTHYGYNYDFCPQGVGKKALEWSRANDAAFIGAVRRGDSRELLDRAEKGRAACSAGAVLGALGFARALNASGAELLAYGSSADTAGTDTPDSFVGYAGLAWFPAQEAPKNTAEGFSADP